MKQEKPVYYKDYLALDQILNAQKPLSKGSPAHPSADSFAHDEMLFIVTHQTYELWFKQVLFEIDWVLKEFQKPKIDDRNISAINEKLGRVVEIFKVLVQKVTIMETMTPAGFLEFRDHLIPASGFQSLQFRLLETKLGRKFNDRIKIERDFLRTRLSHEDFDTLLQANEGVSLQYLVSQWLERFPLFEQTSFEFWKSYEQAVNNMLAKEENIINNQEFYDIKQREFELRNLEFTKNNFQVLFDEGLYLQALNNREKSLSRDATMTALFITLYRHEPLLHQPYILLERLKEIDELLGSWRHRHFFMVQRLLGNKVGTGASSGHDYLKKIAESNRVFQDLFNMASYLLPEQDKPKLPQELLKALSFRYSEDS